MDLKTFINASAAEVDGIYCAEEEKFPPGTMVFPVLEAFFSLEDRMQWFTEDKAKIEPNSEPRRTTDLEMSPNLLTLGDGFYAEN